MNSNEGPSEKNGMQALRAHIQWMRTSQEKQIEFLKEINQRIERVDTQIWTQINTMQQQCRERHEQLGLQREKDYRRFEGQIKPLEEGVISSRAQRAILMTVIGVMLAVLGWVSTASWFRTSAIEKLQTDVQVMQKTLKMKR